MRLETMEEIAIHLCSESAMSLHKVQSKVPGSYVGWKAEGSSGFQQYHWQYSGVTLQHTYQIQIFAGLTEKEALHPVLLGFVDDVMQCSIPTPARQLSSEPCLCSSPPAC